MISAEAVYAVTGGIYAVVLVALLAWRRRIPAAYREYCDLMLFVVVVSGVSVLLDAAELGFVIVNGTEVALPSLVGDLIAYPILWGIAGLLAGISRRTLVGIVALSTIIRLSFTVATVVGGLLALLALAVVVGGHLYFVHLFRTRIWEAAQSVSVEQRLLHWKARNLLLFLIGMIIAFAVLSIFGVFDLFVTTVLTQYMNLLIRVGFAGFLFANVTDVDVTDGGMLSHLSDVSTEEAEITSAAD